MGMNLSHHPDVLQLGGLTPRINNPAYPTGENQNSRGVWEWDG
jgi:hypothetical protein